MSSKDDVIPTGRMVFSKNTCLHMCGFTYHRNRIHKQTNKVYWRCENRNCGSYAQTTLSNIYLSNNETAHAHSPNIDDILIQQFKAQVIKRVRSELVTPGMIHSEELTKANMPASAMANLPTAQTMRKCTF